MRATIVATALALCASAANAQDSEPLPLEVRPFVGAAIPMGGQRALFDDEMIAGVQAAIGVTERFQAVTTFAWIPGTAHYAVGDDAVDIYQYDFGAEFDFPRAPVLEQRFTPFVGLGLGPRSYRYASTQLADRGCLSGYAALGAELRLFTTTFRMEARDIVYCYESPLARGRSRTRSDVTLAIGLGFSLF